MPRDAGRILAGGWNDAAPRFVVAFQPIVSVVERRVVAHEALLRGRGGTPAGSVLAQVSPRRRAPFEAAALGAAVASHRAAGAGGLLHVNACPRTIAGAASLLDEVLPHRDGPVVLELAEPDGVGGTALLAAAAAAARARGIGVALEGFGTGYGGEGLMDAVRPSVAKLDMSLTRNIQLHRPRRSIVAGLLEAASARGIAVIAVGVESEGEYRCLAALGVTLFQGFLFCPPITGALPGAESIAWPDPSATDAPIADRALRERFAREL